MRPKSLKTATAMQVSEWGGRGRKHMEEVKHMGEPRMNAARLSGAM